MSYLIATVLCAWVLNQVLILVAHALRFNNEKLLGVMQPTQLVSLVAMGIAAYFYFRQEKVSSFSTEVVQELKKVTWPTPKNVQMSTVVVIVAVIIVAVILGTYDFLCNWIVTQLLKV